MFTVVTNEWQIKSDPKRSLNLWELYIHFYYVNHDCVLIIVYTHQESKVKGKAAIDVLAARIGKSGGALVQQMIVIIFGDP